MIQIRSTPQHLGIEVAGTSDDFTALYESIHATVSLVDKTGDGDVETDTGLHLLSLAYDLRKAMPMSFTRLSLYRPGQEPTAKDPRSFMEVMGQWDDLDVGDRLHFRRLWPHAIADLVVLQRYLGTWFSRYRGPHKGQDYTDAWAQLVLYRNRVIETAMAIQEETKRSRVRNILANEDSSPTFSSQWVDYLTLDFLKKKPDKRLGALSKLAKNLFVPGQDYISLLLSLTNQAADLGVAPRDLRFEYSWPDDTDW